jgi:hypothetical protein
LVEPPYIEGTPEGCRIIYSPFLFSGRTIPSLCILALKVLGWRPRMAAAPSFPSMRHRVSDRGLKDLVPFYLFQGIRTGGKGKDGIFSLSANCRTGPGHKITARLRPLDEKFQKLEVLPRLWPLNYKFWKIDPPEKYSL